MNGCMIKHQLLNRFTPAPNVAFYTADIAAIILSLNLWVAMLKQIL